MFSINRLYVAQGALTGVDPRDPATEASARKSFTNHIGISLSSRSRRRAIEDSLQQAFSRAGAEGRKA
jgi:hypothetical protein